MSNLLRSTPIVLCVAASLLTASCGDDPRPTDVTHPVTESGAPKVRTPAPDTSGVIGHRPSTTAGAPPVQTYEHIPTPPPQQATVPPAGPAKPKGARTLHVTKTDASSVAHAAVVTMYLQDTKVDNSPSDAARRATRWMTPSYAKAVASPRTSGGGAQWLAWQKHHAYTTVTAKEGTEYGAPADTPTRAIRQYAVTVTPHGRDGWKAVQAELGVTIVLTRHSPTRPWRVQLIRAG